MSYAEIILPLPLDGYFTYGIPDTLSERVAVGIIAHPFAAVGFLINVFIHGLGTALVGIQPVPGVAAGIVNFLDVAYDAAFVFHHQVELGNEVGVVAVLVEHVVFGAAGTVYVPECFAGEVLYFAVVVGGFQSDFHGLQLIVCNSAAEKPCSYFLRRWSFFRNYILGDGRLWVCNGWLVMKRRGAVSLFPWPLAAKIAVLGMLGQGFSVFLPFSTYL